MQDSPFIIYLAVATLSWGLVLYKWKATKEQGLKDKSVLGSWLFIFCFAFSVTLKTEPLYLAIGDQTGINNLALLLSYLCVIVGMYFLVVVCHVNNDIAFPKIASILVLVELLVLGLLFKEIMILPNKANHTIPTSYGEYAFMLTLYLYTIGMVTSPIVRTFTLLQKEKLLSARLRMALLLMATSTGLLLFISKTFFITVALINPLYTHLAPLIFSLFMTLTILTLAIAFLPNQLFQIAANWIQNTHKQRQLNDLKTLQAIIEPFCPPPVTIDSENLFWDKNITLDHSLHRSIIYILDARKILKCVQDPKALQLYEVLQTPELKYSTDFEKLVTIYCQISRQIRKR